MHAHARTTSIRRPGPHTDAHILAWKCVGVKFLPIFDGPNGSRAFSGRQPRGLQVDMWAERVVLRSGARTFWCSYSGLQPSGPAARREPPDEGLTRGGADIPVSDISRRVPLLAFLAEQQTEPTGRDQQHRARLGHGVHDQGWGGATWVWYHGSAGTVARRSGRGV